MMTYTAPPFPTGLKPDANKPSAKSLQAALKAGGFMAASVVPDDNYGPKTQAAVRAFYALAWNAAIRDAHSEVMGAQGWARLFAYALAEPSMDMAKTTHSGKKVNKRTEALLQRFGPCTLLQGSYNTTVAASAGTHDGGGVVDLSVYGMSASARNALIFRLRQFGFAAWHRTPAEGPWSEHVHACAIGDKQMSPVAREQVQAYFNGRNGLSGNGPDTFTGGRPYPHWALKYKQ